MKRSHVRALARLIPALSLAMVAASATSSANAATAPAEGAPRPAASRPATTAPAAAWETLGLPHYVPPPSYSEDLVINAEGKTFTIKRAIDGARSRTEMSADGQKMVMIELGDERGTSYQLMPDHKQAIKQSRASMEGMTGGRIARAQAGHATGTEMAAAAPADVKVEDLGDDTVDGAPARKVRMTSSDGEVLGWFEKATGAPLRMEGTNDGKKATIEWKNRKLEPQPAAMFEVPKNYKLDDMDEMMEKAKSMGGMGGPGGMANGMMSGMMGGMGAGMGGGMAGGMASNMAGSMGSSMGASFGAGLGASLGGPLGAMAGQYIGGRVGGMLGRKAADVVH